MIGQIVKIRTIQSQIPLEVSYYLYQYGVIVGTKRIKKNYMHLLFNLLIIVEYGCCQKK